MSFRDPAPSAPAFTGVVFAYVAAGSLALLASWAIDRNPFETSAWLGTTGLAAATMSAGLGFVIVALTLGATRFVLRRAEWARALHADLRPLVRNADDSTLYLMALASGIGEELLFRGFLVPILGVLAAAALFGALHQVRGRARWGWMAWAALMGVAFGVVFRLTGSLVGPILAHVAINAANLRLLRDHDVEPPRRRALGGILRPL